MFVRGKKTLSIALVSLLVLLVVAAAPIAFAPPPLNPIDQIYKYLTGTIKPILDDIYTHLTGPIASTLDTIDGKVDAIETKLDDWFDAGGTYSKTTQIAVGGDKHTFESSYAYTIYWVPWYPAKPAYKITITISTNGIGAGESLGIYYLQGRYDPAIDWPTYPVTKIVASGSDILAETFEYVVYGTDFKLVAIDVVDGFNVWYNYVLTYEP